MLAVAYYRVSTERQGVDGFGIAAQRETVRSVCRDREWEIVEEIYEVASGTDNARTEMNRAISLSQDRGAILVVSKVDRLTRSVAFMNMLTDTQVRVFACDSMLSNDTAQGVLKLRQLAELAELEGLQTSDRTKEALAQARARGVKLGGYRGGPSPTHEHRARSVEVRQKSADAFALSMAPTLLPLRSAGLSLNGIARHLNEIQIPTRTGKRWQAITVRNVLERLD